VPEASQTFCTSFLSLRQYLGERHGAAAWKRVRETLAERGLDRAYCDSLRGWLQRACIMTGADKLQIAETRCRDRDGAAGCVYEGTW